MSHREHRRKGPSRVPCAVVTVSDTRDAASDRSGRLIVRSLERAGHGTVDYRILRDERRLVARHLRDLARRGTARVVLITGGTGIASRDTTYEAVASLLEKRLDGFGEIFRALSYEAIGPPAMLSRAVAGTFRGMVLFALPGSESAVRLALRRLILPELGHLAGLLEPRGAAGGKRRG
jgi:molybdenum cofactor biosynthesis protein B